MRIDLNELPKESSLRPWIWMQHRGLQGIRTCCMRLLQYDRVAAEKLFTENRSFLSPWVLSSHLCLPTRPSEGLLNSWRLNLTQIKESKLIGKFTYIHHINISNHFIKTRLSFSLHIHALCFLTCFPTLMCRDDGRSRNLTRYLKVLAAIVPIHRWWRRAKGTGGERAAAWGLVDQRGVIALGQLAVFASASLMSLGEHSAAPYHQHLCYRASKAWEQHFSGLLWDLDLDVINVVLMLPCTSRAAFYPSLMWKFICMDVILSFDSTPPPCFVDTPRWAHKTHSFFLGGGGD